MVSDQATRVLRLLKDHHNVLIGGAPATGKTHLLGEVKEAFALVAPPPLRPGRRVPIPPGAAGTMFDWMPSPTRTHRRVFSTAFHQGSKHRDWLRGLIPVPGTGGISFQVTRGVFFEAMTYARQDDSAALVIVDEINRGPAVQVFGDSLIAMETDKRLAPDGAALPTTTAIQVLDDAGHLVSLEVPFDLYLLAAMNRADTSVEPLDVAFLRRWQPFTLVPDLDLAAAWLAITDRSAPVPATPAAAGDVFLALFKSWIVLNHRITLLRGNEYQLGHGALRPPDGGLPATVDDALAFAGSVWRALREHIEELFFGEVRTVASVLSADRPGSPFKLETGYFADVPTSELVGPVDPTPDQLFAILRAISEDK